MPIKPLLLATIAVAAAAQPAAAQKRTYINPIDVDYRYNWEQTDSGKKDARKAEKAEKKGGQDSARATAAAS